MDAVVYDCTRLLGRRNALTPTGIDRVDIHYLNHLLKQNPDNVVGVVQINGHLLAMSREELYTLRDTLTLRWIGTENAGQGLSKALNDIDKRLRSLLKDLQALKDKPIVHPDVIIQMADAGTGQAVYISASHMGLDNETMMFTIKTLLKCRMVLFIHDIIPIDFPEYVAAGGDQIHKHRIWNTASVADLILVNSTYTKERVQDFCRVSGVNCPDIEILYIGTDTQFSPDYEAGANMLEGRKYFVSVGTIEPRKNHIMLLNVWRRWIEEDPNAPYLVLIGKRGWEIATVTNMIDHSPVLRSRIIELSGLSDNDMVAILKGSQGLLFPSFVEGWGMPLAEALSLGVGAVCSDISVFKECGQNLPTYIDPLDSAGWLAELKRIHADPERQDKMRAAARRYVSPKWEEHLAKLSVLVEAQAASMQRIEEVRGGVVRLSVKRSDYDRFKELQAYAEEKQTELASQAEASERPSGRVFERRFELIGDYRCLRLAAEAYIEAGEFDDAKRVLQIALQKSKGSIGYKNIRRRLAVLKKPWLKLLWGNIRFEPYYYGAYEPKPQIET